jgi:hypothetical protein
LKHVCSKWFPEKNRCCLESHPLNEHKWFKKKDGFPKNWPFRNSRTTLK